mgnify:CR=1 FL=1|tara:strand:+ start:10460 stop:10657 length:198 start_codon:yes stop_codon:yes gene_type:complete
MERHRINDAKEIAQRFIFAIEDMHEREKRDEHFRRMMGIVGFKETAAVRRASLDLTRSLAEMRKP